MPRMSNRLRRVLLLAPALAVIVVPLGGGPRIGLRRSLDDMPVTAPTEINLDPCRAVLSSRGCWGSFLLTFHISLATAVLTLDTAFLLRETFPEKGSDRRHLPAQPRRVTPRRSDRHPPSRRPVGQLRSFGPRPRDD